MAMDGICYNCALAERNNQRNKEYWYSGTVKNEIYCRCCKTAFDVDIEGLKVNKAIEKKTA